MKMPENISQPVILFDGICNLCNGFVTFILRYDLKEKFRFAALQSIGGQALLSKYKIQINRIETVILIENDRQYIKSEAVFRIIRRLSGWIKIGLIFSILPRVITDYMYDKIARYRYTIFGKKKECMIPSPEMKNRFLE